MRPSTNPTIAGPYLIFHEAKAVGLCMRPGLREGGVGGTLESDIVGRGIDAS